MATNKMKMMMVVNLKAYTTPQLLSTASRHSPLPMFINKSRYCQSNKRQIITCSSLKVPRFGIANAMASKEIMLLSTAQQPYTTTPFRSTADHQISFEPSCDHLLVVKENITKHAVHMFDTALLEYLEKLEEKLSKANVFSPLLCTIKQLFPNMDKVVVLSELLLLAEKSSITLNLRKMQIIQLCNKRIENMQAKYSVEFRERAKKISKAVGDKLAKPFRPRESKKPEQPAGDSGKGPGAIDKYTFYFGSKDEDWTDKFVKKANVVIYDPCIKNPNVQIELRCIGELIRKGGDHQEAKDLSKLISNHSGKVLDGRPPLHFLRDHFLSGSDGRFVLTYNLNEVVLDGDGKKILKVLEGFPQYWKNNKGKIKVFDETFRHYYKCTT